MVGYAKEDHIGAVGVELLYPDNTIQHAGVVLSKEVAAHHAFLKVSYENNGYAGRLLVPYNYSAVTAACLMVSRKKFNEVVLDATYKAQKKYGFDMTKHEYSYKKAN